MKNYVTAVGLGLAGVGGYFGWQMKAQKEAAKSIASAMATDESTGSGVPDSVKYTGAIREAVIKSASKVLASKNTQTLDFTAKQFLSRGYNSTSMLFTKKLADIAAKKSK